MSASYSFRKIYGSVSILAAITLIGLLFALFGDGVWDALSWVALAIPLILVVWKITSSDRRTQTR